MFLIINTSQTEGFELFLTDTIKVLGSLKVEKAFRHAELLLPAIDSLLKRHQKTINHLKAIAVVKGPGSFSSLRIGVATANALAKFKRLPILGLDVSQFDLKKIIKKLSKLKEGKKIIVPEYGKEPNISSPKP